MGEVDHFEGKSTISQKEVDHFTNAITHLIFNPES